MEVATPSYPLILEQHKTAKQSMVDSGKSHLDGMKRVYRDASIIYVIKKTNCYHSLQGIRKKI